MVTRARSILARSDAVTLAACNFTTGLVVAAVGIGLVDSMASSLGSFGLVVLLLVGVPALYFGMGFVAEGLAIIVEWAVEDARR